MLSTKSGLNYFVLRDGDDNVLKMNRTRTDKAIRKMAYAISLIRSVMKEAHDRDYDLYVLLRDGVAVPSLEFEEGRSYSLNDMEDSLCGIKEILETHTDDVQKALKERVPVTFSRLGYRSVFFGKNEFLFEKLLSEEADFDVREEIIYSKGKLIRRKRKTLWEKTDYGKSSIGFSVRKLKITRLVQEATKNYFAGIR